MIYRAENSKQHGWRIVADYTAVGGEVMHVCLAIDGLVAAQTAAALNEMRAQ